MEILFEAVQTDFEYRQQHTLRILYLRFINLLTSLVQQHHRTARYLLCGISIIVDNGR